MTYSNQLFCAKYLYPNIDKFGWFRIWPQNRLFTIKGMQLYEEKTWLMFMSKVYASVLNEHYF